MGKKLTGVVIILTGMLLAGFATVSQGTTLENSVLRLHVIANSNSPEDQNLKLAVKDEIVALLQQEFIGLEDASSARQLAEQDIPVLEAAARAKITALGYDYPVQVTVGEYDFPDKSYGNLVFPAGKYQAVRVIIGEGQGKNWWCVLFPPLCLVSSAEEGISLDCPQHAQITFKCMELLPRGVRLGQIK